MAVDFSSPLSVNGFVLRVHAERLYAQVLQATPTDKLEWWGVVRLKSWVRFPYSPVAFPLERNAVEVRSDFGARMIQGVSVFHISSARWYTALNVNRSDAWCACTLCPLSSHRIYVLRFRCTLKKMTSGGRNQSGVSIHHVPHDDMMGLPRKIVCSCMCPSRARYSCRNENE